MTKEEKAFCEYCDIHGRCGYVSRDLQYKCEKLQIFADGMQAAIAKVSSWLETEWEDLGINWVRGTQSAEIIDQFKKAMKGD